MLKLIIAGILIEVDSDCLQMLDRFKLFCVNFDKVPDLKISIRSCDKINKPIGNIILDEGIKWLKDYKQKKTYVYKCRGNSNDIIAMLSVDNNWEKACIKYLRNDSESIFTATVSLFEILFRNHILFKDGIVLHAAAIEWQGKGIAFSAASGTGKSTQADLWVKLKGAKVLNDDRPAIRMFKSITKIYGTPWSGSASNYLNSEVPLNVIVVLEQALENSLFKLSDQEAITSLLPRCFMPYHDRELMNIALNNFERIIAITPVYLLKCTPDRAAVELVLKCLN